MCSDAEVMARGTSVLFSFQVRPHVYVYQVCSMACSTRTAVCLETLSQRPSGRGLCAGLAFQHAPCPLYSTLPADTLLSKLCDVSVLQLNDDGGEDDDEGEDGMVSYKEWQLPSADIEGQWDALYYESAIKRRLLQYASTALLFSDLGVNSQLISWNR